MKPKNITSFSFRFLAFFLILLNGCSSNIVLDRGLVNEKVSAYFSCVECSENQFGELIELGPTIIPIMRRIMQDGPSRVSTFRVFRLCQELASACNSSSEGEGSETGEMDECEFAVNSGYCYRYVQDFESTYKIKAARVLAEIGTLDDFDFLKNLLDKISQVNDYQYFQGLNHYKSLMSKRMVISN